jgi:SsrA-binding protein
MAGKKKKTASAAGKLICKNRRARRDYNIQDTLEAGISLQGSEVKSCRQGKASLEEAWVRIVEGEAYLVGCHIAEYEQANVFNHEPTRDRKLLLHRREIDKLWLRLRQQGQTAVPLSMFLKNGRIKVEVGVGKGRSHTDKREVVKEREMQREMDRAMSRSTRASRGR